MKKIFTMFIALLSVTTMSAQTPAQELDGGVFTGSANVVSTSSTYGLSINETISGKTIGFNLSEGDNTYTKVDMSLSEVSVSGSIKIILIPISYTITMRATEAKNLTVSKSGSNLSLASDQFDVVIANADNETSTVHGSVTSSSLNVSGGTSTLKITLTDLPDDLTDYGFNSIDITYSLSLTTPTDVDNAAANTKATPVKVLKDGKVTILKDGVEYNAAGQRCK